MATFGTAEVFLGCQGWTEADWQGPFYPEGIKPADRLASYARSFDFVEIDSSFYAIPPPSSVEKWRSSTPERFRFAAKVPQVITHDPDPKSGFPRSPLDGEGWEPQLARFVETMALLGEKLVALVAQLPPQWHWQPDRLALLDRFLRALPSGPAWAIEFRHRGWLNEQVFRLLRERGVALVLQDLYYMPRTLEVTTDSLVYIRLQGRRKEIVRMGEIQIERDEALDFWKEAVQTLERRGIRRVIVAANNHYQGFAPGTIAALQRMLGLPVSPPPISRLGL